MSENIEIKYTVREKMMMMNSIFNNIMDSESVKTIVDCIVHSEKLPRIILAGVGKNWYICEKVMKTFISMGIHCESLDCTHALHGDLGILSSIGYANEEKIVFFISKSGTTSELIKLARVVKALKDHGKVSKVTTVGYSLNVNKPFSELYDYVICPDEKFAAYTSFEFDERNLVPSLSINIMQMVLDCIGVMIYESRPELVENYVFNHLGGSNGEKLGGNKILETV